MIKLNSHNVTVKRTLTSCICLYVSLISYTEQYMEYDPFVMAPEPSNPWTSDDPSFWDLEARYKSTNQQFYFHSEWTLTGQ